MSEGNVSASQAVDGAEMKADNVAVVQGTIVYRRRSKRATLPADVAASQAVDGTGNQAAEGAGMEAGDVANRPSERKRLPGNADSQTQDGDDVTDDETDNDDVYFVDMRHIQTMVQRRFRLQKKHVGMLRRSLTDMRSGFAELQSKLESNRDFLLGALQTSYQKCKEGLNNETAKMDKLLEELLDCKATHEQAVNDALSELKRDTDRLLKQQEESRKNDEYLASSFIGEIDKLLGKVKKRDEVDKRTANLAMMCGGFVKKLSVLDSTIA